MFAIAMDEDGILYVATERNGRQSWTRLYRRKHPEGLINWRESGVEPKAPLWALDYYFVDRDLNIVGREN